MISSTVTWMIYPCNHITSPKQRRKTNWLQVIKSLKSEVYRRKMRGFIAHFWSRTIRWPHWCKCFPIKGDVNFQQFGSLHRYNEVLDACCTIWRESIILDAWEILSCVRWSSSQISSFIKLLTPHQRLVKSRLWCLCTAPISIPIITLHIRSHS